MPGKYTFKNKTDQDKFVPGVGIVKAGETVPTGVLIENSDFEQVGSQTKPSDPEQGSEKTSETKTDTK